MEKKKEEDPFESLRKIDFLKLEHPMFKIPKTFGQKASDALTKWAGSWVFILSFLAFLVLWIVVNSYFIIQYRSGDPFDPFPFILLNLLLSMLAAIQAPIILMSQNRESQKDRIRAQYDYAVNRKAEEEIREMQDELKFLKDFLIKRKNKKSK